MRITQYKNTCIVGSAYGLAVYLLHMDMNAIRDTYFCVDTAIQDAVNLEGLKVDWFDWFVAGKRKSTSTREWRCRRIVTFFKYFFVRFTKIYAQDQLVFSPLLINRNNYTLLEDAPRIFTICEKIPHWKPFDQPYTIKGIRRRLRMGATYGHFLGTNKYCIDRFITSPDDLNSPYLKNRKYTLLNLAELWESASDEKKSLVLRVFKISKEVFDSCRNCKTILLTQPYYDDNIITEHELVDIYRPYVEKYLESGIVIKPHPRDSVDYTKYFPKAIILKIKAPMELFSVIGMNFENAITVCSMAVTSLPKSVNVIWIGTKVHPNIYRVYPDMELKDIR